jgi:hypothetical protein
MMPPTASVSALAVVLVAAGVSGCGGSDKPAVCSSLDALTASVKNIKGVDLSQAGLSKLKTDLTQVKADLDQLQSDAKDQYASQIDQLKTSLTTLGTDAAAASADPSATTLAPLVPDVTQVGASAEALTQAISGTC